MISRQAAIDIIEDFPHGDVWNVESMEEMVDRIKQLPPIQPKRGKWIEYEQEFMLEEPLKTVQKTVRECSVCTAKIAGMVGIMNFCPNCGAKMEVTE